MDHIKKAPCTQGSLWGTVHKPRRNRELWSMVPDFVCYPHVRRYLARYAPTPKLKALIYGLQFGPQDAQQPVPGPTRCETAGRACTHLLPPGLTHVFSITRRKPGLRSMVLVFVCYPRVRRYLACYDATPKSKTLTYGFRFGVQPRGSQWQSALPTRTRSSRVQAQPGAVASGPRPCRRRGEGPCRPPG